MLDANSKIESNVRHDFLEGIGVSMESFTSTDTLDNTNFYARCDATSAAFTINLPAAATAGTGTMFVIKKIDYG